MNYYVGSKRIEGVVICQGLVTVQCLGDRKANVRVFR